MSQLKRSYLALASAVPVAVVVASGLLVALRRTPPQPPPAAAEPPRAAQGAGPSHPPSPPPPPAEPEGGETLAVTAGGIDRVAKVLDGMGPAYRYETIGDEVLGDAAKLRRYHAVFLTCATDAEAELPRALRDYVSGGGTLYASDLRFDALAGAFPGLVDRASVAQATAQEVRAVVTAEELRAALGPEVTLNFRSDGWRPAAFRGDDVSVWLKGRVRTTAEVVIEVPLLVRFSVGKGAVLFTSFHSERAGSGGPEATEAETKLLRFLALKAVTSSSESRLAGALSDDGFEPRAVAATDAGPDGEPASHVYPHEHGGPLRFRLASPRRSARLRLEVVTPDEKTSTKEGEGDLAVDVADAAPGRWRYRATAVGAAPRDGVPVVAVVGAPASAPADRDNPALPAASANVRFVEVDLGNPMTAKSPRPLRLAVTKPRFDDMGRLLQQLGDGYQYTELPDDALINPNSLDRFDVVFLTCGGWPTRWARVQMGMSGREGVGSAIMRDDIQASIKQTLNRFVNRGGTLYVSDLRYELLGYAFPDRMPAPDLNLDVLPTVERFEKSWLKALAGSAKVSSTGYTLERLHLSKGLVARRAELLAAVYTSSLVNASARPGSDPLTEARDRLKSCGLPATEDDCRAIANAFSERRGVLSRAARSGGPFGALRAKVSATQAFDNARERLFIDYQGNRRQRVVADVVDSGLAEAIGPTITLTFPDNSWSPGRFEGEGTRVLIRGKYRSTRGELIEAPLLVTFRQGRARGQGAGAAGDRAPGAGTVIFTSFHNEAQNDEQELKLLRYLVFSAVTAKQEALTLQTMLTGGFSPVKQAQVNHSSGKDTITRKYESKTGDPLRFALNVSGSGAVLRLTLEGPGGARYEKDTDETLVVEATGAPAGEWLYTVTAVKVPFENFAYSVSIGKGETPKPGRGR